MDRTAIILFSGICAHLRNGSLEAPVPPYRVVLADVSDPANYAAFPLIADLPPHTARLIVTKASILNPAELFAHASGLPVQGLDDAWSWVLDGVRLSIEVTGTPVAAGTVPLLPARWVTDVPSLHAHAPLAAGGQRALDEPGLEARAAAILTLDKGSVVPVNYDARSGGTAVQWHFGVPEGGTVTVTFTALRGQTHLPTIVLKVPEPDAVGPVTPLIQIENIGTTKDDERDFLFHYYALFGFVPANARPPQNLGVVDGGAGVGCSNSSYP